MTNKDLINKIASSTSMTKTRTEEMLSATVAVLQKELLTGKSVQLQGFGKRKTHMARTAQGCG